MFCTAHALLAMPQLLASAEGHSVGGTHHSLLPSHSLPAPKLLGSLVFSNARLQLSPLCFKGFVLSYVSLAEVTVTIEVDNEGIMSIKNYLQINHSFIYLFLGTTAHLQAPLSFWVHLEL